MVPLTYPTLTMYIPDKAYAQTPFLVDRVDVKSILLPIFLVPELLYEYLSQLSRISINLYSQYMTAASQTLFWQCRKLILGAPSRPQNYPSNNLISLSQDA